MTKQEDNQDHALTPPKVFMVPFALLTIPAFIIGTLYAFIEIGWRSGNSRVFRIYFAKAEAEYAKRRAEERAKEAKAIAQQLEEALSQRGIGNDVHVVSMEPRDEDKE